MTDHHRYAPPPGDRPAARAAGLLAGALRRLPALARLPMACIPESAHSRALCAVLNRLLAPELRDGDLDFLDGRCLAIEVTDLGVRVSIAVSGARMIPAAGRAADVRLSGGLEEFVLLAAREEDPDTLFFQRRLHLDGDTELGLAVKNFLDALELGDDRLPGAVAPLAMVARRVAARMRASAA